MTSINDTNILRVRNSPVETGKGTFKVFETLMPMEEMSDQVIKCEDFRRPTSHSHFVGQIGR